MPSWTIKVYDQTPVSIQWLGDGETQDKIDYLTQRAKDTVENPPANSYDGAYSILHVCGAYDDCTYTGECDGDRMSQSRSSFSSHYAQVPTWEEIGAVVQSMVDHADGPTQMVLVVRDTPDVEE